MTLVKSPKRKRVQKVYKTNEGQPTNWPHYRWGRYEVIDSGGFIALYFCRYGEFGLKDEAIGFPPESVPKVVKLLMKAYRNRNWYVNSAPPKWYTEYIKKRIRKLRA